MLVRAGLIMRALDFAKMAKMNSPGLQVASLEPTCREKRCDAGPSLWFKSRPRASISISFPLFYMVSETVEYGTDKYLCIRYYDFDASRVSSSDSLNTTLTSNTRSPNLPQSPLRPGRHKGHLMICFYPTRPFTAKSCYGAVA